MATAALFQSVACAVVANGNLAASRVPLPICEAGSEGSRARATVPVRFPASTLVGIGTISHADPVHE
jgi:hypothetical protein